MGFGNTNDIKLLLLKLLNGEMSFYHIMKKLGSSPMSDSDFDSDTSSDSKVNFNNDLDLDILDCSYDNDMNLLYSTPIINKEDSPDPSFINKGDVKISECQRRLSNLIVKNNRKSFYNTKDWNAKVISGKRAKQIAEYLFCNKLFGGAYVHRISFKRLENIYNQCYISS